MSRFLRDVPIRRKLVVVLLITSLAVMLLMRGSFFTYEYVRFRQDTARQLAVLAQMMASTSTAALAFQNEADAREILAALRAEPNVAAATLYDARGGRFAHYPAEARPGAPPELPASAESRATGTRLERFEPVVLDGRRLGTLHLEFETAAIVRAWLWDSARIALAVMAVVLVLAILLATWLQRHVSAPIISLAATARAVTERGDYSVRAEGAGRDELGQLTGAFNRMLAQIESLNRDLEQRVAQRTAELESANRELEAFSYSVSHDLRAPLRHIAGFAGLLLKSDGAAVSERGRGYLGHITSSARQMGMLIDDLLLFSRMARSEMRVADVDLHQLAADEIRQLGLMHPHRSLRWELAPLPVVPGDPPMLRQVLVNLLGNAVKYTGPRDPAVIQVGVREGGPDEVVVFVRDNGVGFDMQYAPKLFGVFQRLHRAEDFEGTGIGLANVRRIVARHGGRTWAEGEPDRGATFYFSLPRLRPSQS